MRFFYLLFNGIRIRKQTILIPGVAGYNAAKRLGYSIRNPDLVQAREEIEEDKETKTS